MKNLPKCNNEVRQRMRDARVPQWLLAEKLGVHESVLSRMVSRHELPDDEKQHMLEVIDSLAEERRAAENDES